LRKKAAALMVLLLVMAGAYYVTSSALSVAPGATLSLNGFISSLTGMSMALADPVPGTGSGGND
jgi:hypothetical protein